MMKHHQIRYVYLFWALVLMSACGGRFMKAGFTEFSEATALLGKNVEYVMEQSREEELNLRTAESVLSRTVSMDDFQPKVVTVEHLETRKELVKYLTGYTELLCSLIDGEGTEVFRQQATEVYENIRAINQNHEGFLEDEERGVIAATAAAIPEALTAVKRRRMIMTLMAENQSRLEKICTALAGEIQGLQIMLDNFFQRQFRLLVADKWEQEPARREKLVQVARQLTVRREKLNVIMTDLAAALGYIPRTHRNLRETLQKNGSPGRSLAELLDFTGRIQGYFDDFSH